MAASGAVTPRAASKLRQLRQHLPRTHMREQYNTSFTLRKRAAQMLDPFDLKMLLHSLWA
jgi:hypothetical protein